jgi:hypothetical protein
MVLIFTLSTISDPFRPLGEAPLFQPAQATRDSIGKILVGRSATDSELFGNPGHVIEYLLLGLCAARAIFWKREIVLSPFFLSFGACSIYALSDEIHQFFVPGRAFEVQDLVLDACGILFGLIIYWRIRRWSERRYKSLRYNSLQ